MSSPNTGIAEPHCNCPSPMIGQITDSCCLADQAWKHPARARPAHEILSDRTKHQNSLGDRYLSGGVLRQKYLNYVKCCEKTVEICAGRSLQFASLAPPPWGPPLASGTQAYDQCRRDSHAAVRGAVLSGLANS